MTLKVRILQPLTRLFIILVSLMMSLFSEKMLVFNRCISGSMSNLIEKSWKVSTLWFFNFLGSPFSLEGKWILDIFLTFPLHILSYEFGFSLLLTKRAHYIKDYTVKRLYFQFWDHHKKIQNHFNLLL